MTTFIKSRQDDNEYGDDNDNDYDDDKNNEDKKGELGRR